MSNSDFVKTECRHCAGHIEFPADAAGQTIPCPHCGQLTELLTSSLPKGSHSPRHSILPVMAIIFALSLAGGGAWLFLQQKSHPAGAKSALTAPPPATNSAILQPEAEPLITTNQFAILPFKLEKTPGSSLVYVTGVVRNLSDQQRFGVKIECGLLNAEDQAIGLATDYQQVMEPHSDWRFKALVIESKTVSARFKDILEDQ